MYNLTATIAEKLYIYSLISIVSLYVQNYAHKMLKRSYELISFAIITMVVLALSLTVWSNSFTSNLSDIVFRPCTSQELRNSDENWGRNTPFTSRRLFLNSRKQYYDTVEQVSAPTDTLGIFWRKKQQQDINR